MTTEEMSNEFDTLLQSYLYNFDLGDANKIAFDEYEKSVFLTKAQESLVISFINGYNTQGEAFENTEEFRRYLVNLVKTGVIEYDDSDIPTPIVKYPQGLDKKKSYAVNMSKYDDIFMIIFEQVELSDEDNPCIDDKTVLVTPITHDDYFKINRNPFRGASENRVLRVDSNINMGTKISPIYMIELLSKYNIKKYFFRYIAIPPPIILTTFDKELTINGKYKKQECILHPSLHRTILEEAVRIAISSKNKGGNEDQEA